MIEEHVEFEAADGTIPAFTARPDGDGPFAAVIFYMDAPGIREELYDFARRIAGEGYFCLLPDMYYRLGTLRFRYPIPGPHVRKTMFEAMNSLDNALIMSDTEAMLAFLDGHRHVRPGGIGCIGFCMSGQYVVSAAGTFPDRFAASASLYGVGIVTDRDDSPHRLAGRIQGELYLGFAENDEYVPDNVIPELKAALEEHGVDYRLDVYPETGHGFSFPAREVYNEAAAEAAWERVFALYRRRLG